MGPLYRVPVTWAEQVRSQYGATLPGSGHVARTSQIPRWRRSKSFQVMWPRQARFQDGDTQPGSGHVAGKAIPLLFFLIFPHTHIY